MRRPLTASFWVGNRYVTGRVVVFNRDASGAGILTVTAASGETFTDVRATRCNITAVTS